MQARRGMADDGSSHRRDESDGVWGGEGEGEGEGEGPHAAGMSSIDQSSPTVTRGCRMVSTAA